MLLTIKDLPQLSEITNEIVCINENTDKDRCDLIETIHIFINDIFGFNNFKFFFSFS